MKNPKNPFHGKQIILLSLELGGSGGWGVRFVLSLKFPDIENFQYILFPVELKIIFYLL